MANTIKHKQSSVTGKAPTTGQLALGEIAINTTDGKIFIKKNVSGAETVVEVGQTVVDSHVVSSNPHSQYVRNDIGATQTIASNLSIGSGAVSTLEGGQLDLTAAPTSGLGNCSIGVYGASAGSQNIRFLQRDSSNTVTTLTFPQSGGTAWTSSNDGTGSGLDADLLDGQHGAYYLDWSNLNNKPILGTAASKDTPTSGNAVAGQVVLGNDTRLSDARTPTAHNQSWSTITNTPTTLSGYGITDAQAADADLTAIAGLSGNTGFLKKTAANTWSLDTNTYLTANQSITVSGDASGTGSTAISLTLASITDSGTGSFKKISVDGKGRVTGTTAVTASDITGLSGLLSSTAGSALASSGSSGSGTTIARADHVHPYPTPANIGAQSSNATLTSIAGLSTSATGLIKLTAGTASLDTNTYLTANQSITVSGDVSGTGSTAISLTLANSGVVAGTYNNSATAVTPLTIDAKGRVTSAGSAVTITPAWSSVTGKPTTLSGYGITDAQAADADLTAIAGLSGNTGFLKKTAANTWSLDTNTYLTANQSITVSGDASGTGSTAIALTLANSGVTAGTYNNSATAVTPLTVDAKGRITSTGSAVTITPAWSSITSKPTTLSGYGITNAATINSPEFTGTPTAPTASPGTNTTQIATTAFVSTAVTAATTSGITSYANGDISSATLTTSTITSGQVVDQNAATTYRSVKYTVQVKSGTAYQLSELLVLHDGTNAYITEFGNIQTGSTLAVFDADIFGGNLRLLVTPVNAATVIKVIKTLIDI